MAMRGIASHAGRCPKAPVRKHGGKPPPVAWANRQGAPLRRRKTLTMPRIAGASPPARRIAHAISMGLYQCSLV